MSSKFSSSSSGSGVPLGCIVVPFGLVFALVFGGVSIGIGESLFLIISGAHKAYAEEQLAEYVEGTALSARQCQRADSDGNGYVSGTVLSQGVPKTVECAAKLSLNRGCREPKLVAPVGLQ